MRFAGFGGVDPLRKKKSSSLESLDQCYLACPRKNYIKLCT